MSANINFNRIKRKLDAAQEFFIKQIKNDTEQYVPAKTLNLSNNTEFRENNTKLVYKSRYARFQYKGYVMTDEKGRVFVNKGEKKPIVTNIKLKYNQSIHSKAQDHWFEKSKKDYVYKWIKSVKDFLKNAK